MSVSVGGLVTSYNNTADNNYDTPTNPLITKSSSAGDRLFTVILHDNNSANTVISEPISGSGLHTQYSNLHSTDGFSIRCHDSTNPTAGLDLSSVAHSNGVPTSGDYFVLVHSDNHNLHHFARITKIVAADNFGDKFEFRPRLGKEIAKDVKFMVFKTTKAIPNYVAISLGIKRDIAKYVCSKPLFYFYDEEDTTTDYDDLILDKIGELNHNTKYFMQSVADSSASATLQTGVSGDSTTFVTIPDYRNKIIDYSKFSYNIKMVDKLKQLDDPDVATSNENTLLPSTYNNLSDYNACFVNAVRDADDALGLTFISGAPKRYIHYRFSPESNNRIPIAYECNIEDSFDKKTGFASVKMVDVSKNLATRINTPDRLLINQKLGEEQLTEFVEVGQIVSKLSTTGSGVIGFHTYSISGSVENPNEYFARYSEIKIGEHICIVSSSTTAGQISIKYSSRTETESAFTLKQTLTSQFTEGTKIFRRRLNPINNTVFTSVNFSENKLARMSGIFVSNQYADYHVPFTDLIANIDEDYGLLTLKGGVDNKTGYDALNMLGDSFGTDSRGASIFNYIKGSILINFEVFFGEVEQTERKLENNQTIFEVVGRNTLSKLTDVIINQDIGFLDDIIQSSTTAYNKLSVVSNSATWHFDSPIITFGSAVTIPAYTHLWSDWGYIGQLTGGGINNSTTGSLIQFPRTQGTSDKVFKETTKLYQLAKASASNTNIESVSSLFGVSDKGFYFKDGNTFTGSGFTVKSEGASLIGRSDDSNPNSVGFNIDISENIDADAPFLLDIENFEDDVVNTLIDFTVLEVNTNKETKVVKLAPYVPLTLGREALIEADTTDIGITSIGVLTSTGSKVSISGQQDALISTLRIGQPLYCSPVSGGDIIFVGRFIGEERRKLSNGTKTCSIFLDRSISSSFNGQSLGISNGKKNRFLHLTNGEHLHSCRTINMVGPNRLPIDYEIDSTYYSTSVSGDSYKEKFGADNFRIFNLEKGSVGHLKDFLVLESSGNADGRLQPYYEGTVFKYFAQAYKGSPYVTDGLTHTKKTGGTANNHDVIEQRGLEPITGSNYINRKYYEGEALGDLRLFAVEPREAYPTISSTPTTEFDNPITIRDKFYHPDAKAARLFLFTNSDIRLYSSDREDSLMSNESRTIQSYGLLSYSQPTTTQFSISKSNTQGSSSASTNLDQDFKHSSIIESSKTLSSLKRFGLMRLTDVVMDFAYNIINPEFDVPNDRVVESFTTTFFPLEQIKQTNGLALNLSDTSQAPTNAQFIFANTIANVAQNDLVVDVATNKVVGKVASISTTNNTNDTINFAGQSPNATAVDGDYIPTGSSVFVIKASNISNGGTQQNYVNVIGRGTEDTMLFRVLTGTSNNRRGNDIHMLKGVFAGLDTVEAWRDHYTQDNTDPTKTDSATRNIRKGNARGKQTVILPFALEGMRYTHPTSQGANNPQPSGMIEFRTTDSNGDSYIEFDVSLTGAEMIRGADDGSWLKRDSSPVRQSELFFFMDGLHFGNNSSIAAYDAEKVGGLKAVGIKGLPTEATGTGNPMPKAGITTPLLQNATLSYVYKPDGYGAGSGQSGRELTYMAFTTSSDFGGSDSTPTAGVYLGFKPHLNISSASNTDVKSNDPVGGNNVLKKNTFNLTGNNQIFKNMDLTGCYLVPAASGKKYVGDSVTVSNSFDSPHKMTVDDIIYVVSHEYDINVSGGPQSVILTDKNITSGRTYKVMQPNPICFWEKSPKKIRINTLSSEYTKQMDSDEMVKPPSSFSRKPDLVGPKDDESNEEGVQSMYIIVDMDNLSSEDSTVVKTANGIDAILTGIDGEYCISDGNTHNVTNLKSDIVDSAGKYLEFSNMKKIDGIASVSETFELKVNGDINNDAKRAMIGTTIDVCKELEDTVEELLIENDIKFDITKEDYKILTAPNFQGDNLFNALNYLLELKDKKMINESGVIKIKNRDDSQFISKYLFTDDDITDISINKSKFNYFNQITVYGNSHKVTKKDFREINKKGKKVLEVFRSKLKTKDDVDKEANKLLKIHTKLNNVIEISLPVSKVKTLAVGDTIELESESTGLERNRYIILETKHQFSGLVVFKLGFYIKGLEDTLSELLLENKQAQSHARKGEFIENENEFDFFDSFKIKETHILIRKRTPAGVNDTIGFNQTLGFGGFTLGFGNITFTKLLEEDL